MVSYKLITEIAIPIDTYLQKALFKNVILCINIFFIYIYFHCETLILLQFFLLIYSIGLLSLKKILFYNFPAKDKFFVKISVEFLYRIQ